MFDFDFDSGFESWSYYNYGPEDNYDYDDHEGNEQQKSKKKDSRGVIRKTIFPMTLLAAVSVAVGHVYLEQHLHNESGNFAEILEDGIRNQETIFLPGINVNQEEVGGNIRLVVQWMKDEIEQI